MSRKMKYETDLTSQAPPSLLPAKKYCDITGLPAKYTDPKTRLHFRGLEVLDVIRGMVRAVPFSATLLGLGTDSARYHSSIDRPGSGSGAVVPRSARSPTDVDVKT